MKDMKSMKVKPESRSQNSESRIRGFGNRFFGVLAPWRDEVAVSSAFSLQPSACFSHHEEHEEKNLCNLWTAVARELKG